MAALIEKCFIHASYYIITLLVFVWLLTLLRFYREYNSEIRTKIKSSLPGLIFSVVLAVIIFVSVRPGLRVLNDEINLLSVSRSMVHNKTAVVIDEAIQYQGTLDIKSAYIDKRPLLFPYLASILHTLLGYRVENVFVLNFMVLLSLFILVCVFLQGYVGTVGVICCLLLIAGQPIVSLTATSGIFDLLSAMFMFVCLASTWVFISRPTPVAFAILWLNCLLWSNIRYECFIYFLIILVLLGVFGYLKRTYLPGWRLFAITPVFFLPLILQRICTECDTQVPKGNAMFSPGHFAANNLKFFEGVFSFDFYQPYASIVILLGVAAVVYVLFRLVWGGAHTGNSAFRRWLVVAASVFLANWVIVSSYYHPVDDVVTCRFYIPFCIGASVLAALFLKIMPWIGNRPAAMLCVCLALFALYHPVAVENKIFKDRAGYRRNYYIVCDYISRLNQKNILLVAPFRRQFIINGYSSIGFALANNNAELYLERYKHRLFEDIYIVQEVDYSTMVPRQKELLKDVYGLQPVYELQSRKDRFIRISKVINER
jgi:hypothetical protein